MEGSRATLSSQKIGYDAVVKREERYLWVAPIEFWRTTDSPIKMSRLQELLHEKTVMPKLLERHVTGNC